MWNFILLHLIYRFIVELFSISEHLWPHRLHYVTRLLFWYRKEFFLKSPGIPESTPDAGIDCRFGRNGGARQTTPGTGIWARWSRQRAQEAVSPGKTHSDPPISHAPAFAWRVPGPLVSESVQLRPAAARAHAHSSKTPPNHPPPPATHSDP